MNELNLLPPVVAHSLTDYEAAVKRHKEGVRFILKYHSNQKGQYIVLDLHSDLVGCIILCIFYLSILVDVALAHNSTPSDQLKAALVVELLDFILQTKNIATV